MASYPLVNGNKYDYASIEIDLGEEGGIVTGITEISYTESVERGEARGTHPQVLGRTRGQYSCEGSITFLKKEFQEFIAALGDGWLDKSFEITVTYSEPDGDGTITDVLSGVKGNGAEDAPSQGTDALTVTMPLSILYIIRGGVKPLSNMLGVESIHKGRV